MKIRPLPQAREKEQDGEKKAPRSEMELVPGSNEFRKHLEMLAGLSGAGENDGAQDDVLGLKDAPIVKLRTSADGAPNSATPPEENEPFFAALQEAEEEINRVESIEAFRDEPSILDLYRERLIVQYGFSADDPVFALCEIFDEVRRRDLEKTAASERFLVELGDKAERSLAGLIERSAILERCLKEGHALESSIGELGKLVERLEEALVSMSEQTAAQVASLSVVQGELKRSVAEGARRMRLDRVLHWVILAGIAGLGFLLWRWL
jgi:hypothetical protein